MSDAGAGPAGPSGDAGQVPLRSTPPAPDGRALAAPEDGHGRLEAPQGVAGEAPPSLGEWTPMDPRARPLVWGGYASVCIASLAVPASIGALVAQSWTVLAIGLVAVLVVSVAVGRWLAGLLLDRARFRREGWTLVQHDGALWHHERHVPVVRIQHVDLREGVLDQRLGLAELTIHTAAPAADVTLEKLAADLARAVRTDLLAAADAATASLAGDHQDGA